MRLTQYFFNWTKIWHLIINIFTYFVCQIVSVTIWCTKHVKQKDWIQLNKYGTDQYFLQLFQSNTTVCLIIHVFCKSCDHEIVFVLICTLAEQFHVRKSYKTRESILSCIGNFEENIDLSHIYSAVMS